jgi:hypothetical protein
MTPTLPPASEAVLDGFGNAPLKVQPIPRYLTQIS